MNFWDNVMVKWNRFLEKADPFFKGVLKVIKGIDKVLMTIWRYLLAFKKLWISIPIGFAAIMLALNNLAKLPAVVGLNLQKNGVFATQIPRELAVFCPLLVTLICLLLMFCSRRTLTPWFVSLASLALPVVILLINTFPG